MGETLGGDRTRRTIGWALAGVSVLLLASVPLSLSGDVLFRPGIARGTDRTNDWLAMVVVLTFTLSGAGLVRARPRNLIGWLLLGCGVLQPVQMSTEAYGARALTDPDGSLPLGLASMWVATWTWEPAILLPLTVLPALYPAGRPASRFWLWHVRVALAGMALLVVTAASAQGGVDDTVAGTRLSWDAPGWWLWITGGLAGAILILATAVSIVGTVVRALRARTPERQQLVWLVCVLTAMVSTVFLSVEKVFGIAYGLVPIAVVVGVLRYRLLGIEVAVRRTLLYAPLTLLVALVVGGLTTLLARLAPRGPLPLLAASAVVAVLLFPVADRLRRLIDRFVLGERADPLAVVDRGAGLEIATSDPVPSMLEAVARSVGASYAMVRDAGGSAIAVVGEPAAGTLELPLRHSGELLGTVSVGPRHGEPRVTDRDARLLEALAPHLAVVVRSRKLAAEPSGERERVLTATRVERDRLRRDLHDGLGPSLSGIALGLQAAQHALADDPDAAGELLSRTRAEAESAVMEIRRVLDALRPSTLDQHGLVGAVRQTASLLGLGVPGGTELAIQAADLPVLAPQVEEAAYRIVAESLTNVARHSNAHACVVTLDSSGGSLRLGVRDDGNGGAWPRSSTRRRPSRWSPRWGTATRCSRSVEQHGPDVVVTDLTMPGLDGVAATRRLLAVQPDLAVLVLTMHEDDEHVLAALRAGARGYLVKGADGDDIVRAVQAVATGGAVYGGSVAHRIVRFYAGEGAGSAADRAFPNLTPRERNVLELLATGCRNHEIARRLGMSEKTVRNHVSQVLLKLQVPDRIAAALRARESGLG